MASGELIPEDLRIDWQRYCLSLDFYPTIKLTRRDGLSFAESITEYLEPETVQPGVSEWKFSGGAICEGIHLRITKRSITFDAYDPSNNLEWYEHRFGPMLSQFGQRFSPQVALRCNVTVSGLVSLPDSIDARSFLGGHVMLMDPRKLTPIDRPLHVLGVRLLFSPFETEEDKDGNWSVNARIESAYFDTEKLFLEAEASWDTPQKWSEQQLVDAVNRLNTVSTFISDKLVNFLRQPPSLDKEDDDNEE